MSIIDVVNNFSNQDNELGHRVRLALSYQDAMVRGDMSTEEYHELMQDLQRLENIQLAAAELDQQIAFNECIELLKNIPIP